MRHYENFHMERDRLVEIAKGKISKILLTESRMEKHAPYTWLEEDQDEHLLKGIRHVITAMNIRNGYQDDDGDDHLANAITRLVMAVGLPDSNR